MSMLINNAKVSFEHAKTAFNTSKLCEPDMTEANIRKACFELQQTMEFFLKGLIELKGEAFIEKHPLQLNINILLNIIEKGVMFINIQELKSILDEISQNAYKFNMWEASARYKNTFLTTENEIIKALDICGKLADYCDNEINCN